MNETETTSTLKAEGVDVRWHFKPSESVETLLANVEIVGTVPGPATIRSVEFAMERRDLGALGDYLERHLEALKDDPWHTSPVFMRYDLGYQIEAGEGDVKAHEEAELSLTILLNVGSSPSGSRVYAGTRSVVSVASTRAFIAETRRACASSA